MLCEKVSLRWHFLRTCSENGTQRLGFYCGLLACVQVLRSYRLWLRFLFATVLGGCLDEEAGTWFCGSRADFGQMEC
jgi:hypothetical protein